MNLIVATAHELGLANEHIQAFYEANWLRRIALSDTSFYDWQFVQPPAAGGLDHCLTAFDADARQVVGVMGLNPRRFHLDGVDMQGAELTTWIVSDACRGLGVGKKMIAALQDRFDVMIGMGISEAALPVYISAGFRYLAAIPRHLQVYDFDAIAGISEIKPAARLAHRAWTRDVAPATWRVEPDLSDAGAVIAERCDALHMFDRSPAQLDWRYARHPYFDYEQFVIASGDGESRVYVALRRETTSAGVVVVHIVDLIGRDAGIPSALAFIDAYCRKSGAHVADFFCTAATINRHVRAAGWFSAVDDRCLVFPHLFRPVEIRNPPTTSLIYWSRSHVAQMCDMSRLYITKQDADLDRPILGDIG